MACVPLKADIAAIVVAEHQVALIMIQSEPSKGGNNLLVGGLRTLLIMRLALVSHSPVVSRD